MIYLVILALVIAYGVWYAVDPMRVLRRKYGNEPLFIHSFFLVSVAWQPWPSAGILLEQTIRKG